MKQDTETRLLLAGVSPVRAARKAEDSAVGWALVLTGIAFWIVVSALAVFLIVRRNDVNALLLALVGVPASLGFLLFGAGMHLIAREGTPSPMQAVVDLLIKVIQAIRGKNGAGARV